MSLNLIQAHEKIKGLEWEFSYADPRPQFQTKFHIPKKGKDPFRHLIRDYMAMEAEKDDRQYGKTLMAQPSLDRTRRWTIDDIERLGYKIKNPLRAA